MIIIYSGTTLVWENTRLTKTEAEKKQDRSS